MHLNVEKELLCQHLGALFVIDGYTIAIIHHQNKFYIFDSHSRDSDGKQIPNGTSVLLRFKSLKLVKVYIQDVYNTNFFNVLYIKASDNFDQLKTLVNKSILKKQKNDLKTNLQKARVGTEIQVKINEKRRQKYESIIGTEVHNKMNEKRRQAYDSIIGTEAHNEIKRKKRLQSRQAF